MRRNAKRMLTDSEVLVVFEMWDAKKTRAEIASELNISITTLDERKKDQLASLPRRQGMNGGRFERVAGSRISDEPTPEQLADMDRRRLEVQARWTTEERIQRMQGIPDTTQHVRDIQAAYRNA